MTKEAEKIALGERMRQAADAAGLSQQQIADRMGVHAETVWRWFNGKRSPRIVQQKQFAEIVGVPVSTLYAEPESPAAEREPAALAREMALDILITWADTLAAGGSMEGALEATGAVPREVSMSQLARLSAAEDEIRAELASFSGGAWGSLSNEEKRVVLQRLMDRLLPAAER